MKTLIEIKQIIKPFMPQWVLALNKAISKQVILYRIKQVQSRYPKILSRLKEKNKVRVAFFLSLSSIWKCDKLFQLMLEDNKFDPIIVICPYILYYEKDAMMRNLKQAEEFIRSKKYPYVMTLNFETGEWLNVKKEIKPDIIFFTNPYDGITKKGYSILNFPNSLTCYVPYSIGDHYLLELSHNLMFHNLLWKIFAETDAHKQFATDVALNKGSNVITTGLPGADVFLDKNYIPKNLWKEKKKGLKKIIWAPHHTIDDGSLSFSSFLMYSDYMLELATKYKNFVQFVFKPHPLLKPKLYVHSDWGQIKTDNYYYSLWDGMENTQLEEGEYEDLFLTSDAMIHDCGSFLIEYLYVNKPVLRTNRDDSVTDRLNKFGIMAYNMHYHAWTKEDIEAFVKNVIEGNDEMKKARERFRQEYLLPPNNQSATNNIFNEIKSALK